MLSEHVFSDKNALFEALYSYCIKSLKADLEKTKQVSLLLSGGSTPYPFYKRLSESELPWLKIFPALVDERWVDINDPDSNEGMLRTVFANNSDFLRNLTGLYQPYTSIENAASICNEQHEKLPKPISLCLLGMGLDGHTASLFPQAQGLEAALNTAVNYQAILAKPSKVTGKNTTRMSLTISGILRAKRIVLLITGEDKWKVYQQARISNDALKLPVSALLQEHKQDIHIFYSP